MLRDRKSMVGKMIEKIIAVYGNWKLVYKGVITIFIQFTNRFVEFSFIR